MRKLEFYPVQGEDQIAQRIHPSNQHARTDRISMSLRLLDEGDAGIELRVVRCKIGTKFRLLDCLFTLGVLESSGACILSSGLRTAS